jgi:HSP20 family protein
MTMLMEPFAPTLRDLSRYLSGGGGGASGFLPAADVLVTDEDVTVHMDVPGLSQSDIEIELENDVLTVRGSRPYPYEQMADKITWQRIERPFGQFERVLRVPRGMDPNAVEASLRDGVLTLRIPKPEPLRPHRIEVRGGESQAQPIEGTAASQQPMQGSGAPAA